MVPRVSLRNARLMSGWSLCQAVQEQVSEAAGERDYFARSTLQQDQSPQTWALMLLTRGLRWFWREGGTTLVTCLVKVGKSRDMAKCGALCAVLLATEDANPAEADCSGATFLQHASSVEGGAL